MSLSVLKGDLKAHTMEFHEISFLNVLPSYQYWFIVLSFFPHRAYLDVKELKEILQLDGSTHLNIFFANSSDEELAGVATWPWDKEALTHLGRKPKHTWMQAHTFAWTNISYAIFSILTRHCSYACSTACVFLYILQAVLCWILPSMAPLVTLTPWSTRLVTVSAFTTCFGVYRRWNRATTRVWRLSPRWKLEICVQTPTPLPNTKAATILIQAMKPVGAGTSRTRPSTTTWVMLVSYKPKIHTLPFISRLSPNHLCRLQTTPARIPSPWTRWRGCTVTWTSSTRPGSQSPNPPPYQCRRKWWNSIIIPSPWNGFIPSRDTFTTGEMSCICWRDWTDTNLQHHCGTLKCCSTHVTHVWPVSKLFALPVCWFPREVGSVCDKCTEGRVLLQYASNSSSPRPCDPSGHWSPREAEGTSPDIFADATLMLDNMLLVYLSFPPYLFHPNISNISTLL